MVNTRSGNLIRDRFFKKNKEEFSIDFWTTVPGLSKVPEVVPRKQSKIIPEWWRSTQYYEKSIKQCPNFPQLFSSSYVIPMWCDSSFHREGDMFFWETADNKFSWENHSNDQFLDHAPRHIREKYFIIAKAMCPWRIKTPKGYSVLQMSPLWHFNKNFEVASGIVDTDFHHEINQQIFLSLEDGESFMIERGDPFAVYMPFKRDSFAMNVREESESDKENRDTSELIYSTKFINGYRSHQQFIRGNK